MVDLTNRLGFRTLYHHSLGNRNNIALSPCGLASVLVALYEGSDGPSAVQIHKAMDLPWDRDLIRIGFRDIHRRLRSYFYSQDNLLSGLSLSVPNVTVRPEYENILRFYGYDLENGNMITTNGGKSGDCKEENETMTTEMPEQVVETTTLDMEEEETTIEMTTEPPTTTTTTPIPSTTKKQETIANTEGTTIPTTAPPPPPATTEQPETEETTVAEARTTQYIFKFKPPKTTPTEALEATTQSLDETATTSTSSSETTTEVSSDSSSTADDLNALKRRRRRKNRTFNNNHRWRRSPFPLHYLLATETAAVAEEEPISAYALFNGGMSPHPQQQFSINDYVVQQPSFNLKDSVNETPQHEDVITHVFYLNRQDTINVPFKVFNSIIKFGYFSEIQVHKYYIIIKNLYLLK